MPIPYISSCPPSAAKGRREYGDLMGKINSRDKGARFERELANILKQYGYESRRGQQFSGSNGDADVIGLPMIHIEAKHCETMQLYKWMEQAKRDASKNGRLPAVFHRKNRAAILVTMELDDWMKIYRGERSYEAVKDNETSQMQNTEDGEER